MTTSIGGGACFRQASALSDRLQRDLATKAEKHVQLCRFATRPLLYLNVRHLTCTAFILVLSFYSIQSAVVLLHQQREKYSKVGGNMKHHHPISSVTS